MVVTERLILLVSLFGICQPINVPGVTPHEFQVGDTLEVDAVKLMSSKTQLPYRYYDLEFCPPEKKKEYTADNIGEILRGDRLVNTPYQIKMAINIPCKVLCERRPVALHSLKQMASFIREDYYVYLTIDNLIGSTAQKSSNGQGVHYTHGYSLGTHVGDQIYLNNHLKFKLQYNTVDNDKHRFVGFEIEPMSLSDSALKVNKDSCNYNTPVTYENWKSISEATSSLVFSYEVVWEASNIRWASRWDVFLRSEGGQVHWFAILNSLVIVIFLTGVIAMILIRSLRRDIAKYNRDDDVEDILEESGWKLVHGDVFRPPRYNSLLTALLGSGIQVLCMVFIIIFFAMLGMLSPTARGAIMSAALFTYVFMGLFAGYYAGRFYKTMRGLLWKSTAFLTGTLFPLTVLSFGFVMNSFVLYKRSSAAVPFTTMLSLLALWLGISLPLVFAGFYFGYRKRGYAIPVRTNQIPRAVPLTKMHQSLLVVTLLGGLLPFGAVFIEVFFIYLALWESRFYYLFGFLFLVFIILIICCSQVAIVTTYTQLCNEDYRWWWRTFISSGGPAVYLFLYSIFYYWTKLTIDQFVPTIVYFGYTLLMTFTFWILTGTIGFVATFVFLRYIYSAIKID